MTATVPVVDDRLARRNLLVLISAGAVLGSQLPMAFVIGAIAGLQIAPNPCFATLPLTFIVLGSSTTSPWLSALMQKRGRRTGFTVGALGGAVGGLTCAYAMSVQSFPLLLLGSYFIGYYQSSQAFFRFAVIDTASEEFRPKAISLVLTGGLAAAIIGPQLVKLTTGDHGTSLFATYLAMAALNVVGVWIFLFLKTPVRAHHQTQAAPVMRTRRELLATPEIAVPIVCAMVSYALMSLMMTAAPLAVVSHGFHTDHAADIVSAHVLGMFLPSFFTGYLIARFGARRIVATGLFILFCAGLVALSGVQLLNFFGALILLGVGWNFGFIGATTMLTRAYAPNERARVQGMNDFFLFAALIVATLASGGLLNCTGGTPTMGWNSVTYAMVPFLALAGAALMWLMIKRPRKRGASAAEF